MKPLPVYSIELRLAAPMAVAAAASLPASCAWLSLAITSTSATVTVRSIVPSLPRHCVDHWRVYRTVVSPEHSTASRNVTQGRSNKRGDPRCRSEPIRGCLGLTFGPLLRQYASHASRADQRSGTGDEHEVPGNFPCC